MREIKFRGMDKDSGEFVYGGIANELLTASGFIADFAIMPPRCYGVEVNPETVGQYTGLKDCNGVEIYEGDVVRSDHFIDVDGEQHYVRHTCEWSDKHSGWYFRNNSESFDGDGGLQAFVMMKFLSERNIKVIGNIHQNPELIR